MNFNEYMALNSRGFDSRIAYDPTNSWLAYDEVIINVENIKNMVLRASGKDYVLNFQKLLEDYGIEVS